MIGGTLRAARLQTAVSLEAARLQTAVSLEAARLQTAVSLEAARLQTAVSLEAARLQTAVSLEAARLAMLLAAVAAPGCCLTGGWHECDSSTHVGGCTGAHYEYCFRSSSPWSGEVEELITGDCASDEVCIEPSPGLPACVLAPATPCVPELPAGRCDGETPAVCTAPNSCVTDTYLIHGSTCSNGWHCTVHDGYASCVPP